MDKSTYLYFFVIMVIKNNNAYRHRCSLLDDHPRDEYFIIEIELKDSTCTGHPAESTGLSDL
jgi:hypothetical protein